jgi:antitoxin ParD1/3/4
MLNREVFCANLAVLSINTGDFMSRTTSITIGSQLDGFVNSLIASGRYGSTSEVVRSALRLLEQEENQTAMLRQALQAGEDSGESELTLEDIAKQVRAKHGL